MGGGGKYRKKRTTGKKSKKPSNYANKGLNNDLTDALGGAAGRANAKANSELFTVDATGGHQSTGRLSVRERAAEAVLQEKSRKRQRNEELQEKINKLEQIPETEGNAITLTLRKQDVSKTEEVLVKKVLSNAKPAEQTYNSDSVYDLWGSKCSNSRKRKIKEDCRDEKFSAVKYKVCGPGGSYMPTEKDQYDGLKKVVEAEQQRLELIKPTPEFASMFAKLNEKKMKLTDEIHESSDEEENEIVEDGIVFDASQTKKLTRTQRNKQRRHALHLADIKKRKEDKAYLNQLKNAKSIAKQVKREEREKLVKFAEKQAELQKRHEEREPTVIVNGKNITKTKPKAVDVVLPSHRSDNLRRMVVHGNVMKDLYDNMQARRLFDTGDIKLQKANRKRKEKVIATGKNFIGDAVAKPTEKGTKKQEKHIDIHLNFR